MNGRCNLLGRFRLPYGAVSAVVGAVLLVAAALKTHELATGPLDPSDVLGNRHLWIALVEVQIALGLAMLLGLLPRFTQSVAILLFGAFVLFLVYALATGQQSCRCFGKASVWPGWVLVGDLSAIACLVLARHGAPSPSRARREFWGTRAACEFALTAIVGAYALAAMASFRPGKLATDGTIVGGNQVVLNPYSWIGLHFPLERHLVPPQPLDDGDCLLLLVNPGCHKCETAVAKYSNPALSFGDRHVIMVLLPSLEEGEENRVRDLTYNWPHAVTSLSTEATWHVSTPLEVILRGGVVTAVNTL